MHLFVYVCTLFFLHGLTVHKWQTHKISVFCTSATCKCTIFLFCLFVQVLNAQVFFVLQHAFSLQ